MNFFGFSSENSNNLHNCIDPITPSTMEEQIRLFEIIKAKIPDHYRLADVVEELLSVSADAAYRRIRGEKPLTFPELVKLCRHFNLSADQVMNQTPEHGALFRHATLDVTDQNGYMQYMQGLLNILTQMEAAPDKELLFTALDIPFYHFLKYPELTFFKLYCWDDVVSRTRITYEDFVKKTDRKSLEKLYEQITAVYSLIPAKELWTDQTINTIISQFDYYFETGAFAKKETALNLLEQLSQLMESIQKDAEKGYKGDKRTPFALYLSSVDLANNFMVARIGDRLSCSIKMYIINSITTENPTVCAEAEKWIRDLISKSILISGSSGRERFRFFQTSLNKIADLSHKTKMAVML